MALTCLIGRSGSGKTTWMLSQLAAAQQEGRRAVYLVPEQFSLQAEKDLLLLTNGRGILEVKVLTFHRLAHMVFSRTGAPKNRPLDEISRALVLRKVVLETEKELAYFQKAAKKRGFLEQLGETIGEFFCYGITAEELARAAQEQTEHPALADKLKDISRIYGAYCRYLEEGYLSSDEMLDLLYDALDQDSWVRGVSFYVDGFYGFTAQEKKILQKLMALGCSLHVALTMEPKDTLRTLEMTDLFYEPKQTYLALRDLAWQVGASVAEDVCFTGQYRAKPAGLRALEAGYGTFLPQPGEREGIQIYSLANRFEEGEKAALQILRLVREEGCRYREIGVLASDLSGYTMALERAFDQCGIPYFLDEKKKVTDTRLAGAVLLLLQVIRFGFRFDDVFGFLKTGFAPFTETEIERLENYCLSYGIRGKRWQQPWHRGLEQEQQQETYLFLNGLRERLVTLFSPLTAGPKKRTVSQWNRDFCTTLADLGWETQLEAEDEAFQEAGEQAQRYENRQSYQALLDVLAAMEDILGQEAMTFADYAALMEGGLSVGKLAIIPPSADCVTVGTVERSRLPRLKVLLIVGANEGLLPAGTKENGILTEDQRVLLAQGGMTLAHSGQRAALEERYRLYCAMTQAEEQLILSYSRSDLMGAALAPSMLVGRIARMFPSEPQEEALPEELTFFSPQLTLDHLGSHRETEDGALWTQAWQRLREEDPWREQMSLLEMAKNRPSSPGYLSAEVARRAFGDTLFSSISRLETFASCPYRYFLTYTLGAKERKIYGLANPDLGILFHDVLEQFGRQMKQENRRWEELDREEVVRRAAQAVEVKAPAIGGEVLLSTGAMQYLMVRLARISARAIWTLARHLQAGSFRPAAFELTFGQEGLLPPIVVELGAGRRLVLTGKIDRVDVWEQQGKTYLKILDYKTGQKEFQLLELFYGLQLQLLVYLDALMQEGKPLFGQELLPAGVFYFRVQDPVLEQKERLTQADVEQLLAKKMTMSGLVLDDAEVIAALDGTMAQTSDILPVKYNKDGSPAAASSLASEQTYGLLQRYAVDLAKRLAQRIQAGEIRALPLKEKSGLPCRYCPYQSICGHEEGLSPQRSMRARKKEELLDEMRQQVDGSEIKS